MSTYRVKVFHLVPINSRYSEQILRTLEKALEFDLVILDTETAYISKRFSTSCFFSLVLDLWVAEAAIRWFSSKFVFLKNLQYSQGDTFARVSF